MPNDPEYIYLYQDRDFVNKDEPIYTIGKFRGNKSQVNPKGSILLIQVIVQNCDQVYKDLLEIFNKKYKRTNNYNQFQGQYQSMIDEIIKKQKEPPMSIDKAAKRGELDTLKWWYNKCGYELTDYTERAIDLASANGHIHILDWLFKIGTESKPWILKYSPRSIDWAAARGHIHVLGWWLNKYKNMNIVLQYTEKAIDFAATQGRIEILEWFLKHSEEYYKHITDPKIAENITVIGKFKHSKDAMDFASIYGYVDILNWFLENSKKYNIELKFDLLNAINLAAARGHANILDWWLKHYKEINPNLNFDYSENAIDWAAESGFVHILDWFLNFELSKNNEIINLKYTKWAMNWASFNGHIKVLEWFKTISEKHNIELKFSKHVMDWVSKPKHICILNFWLNLNTTKPKYTKWAINWAASNGNIHILDWWLKVVYKNNFALLNYSEWAINLAVSNGHIKVLEWFFKHCSECKNLLKYDPDIISWPSSISREQQVKVSEWLKNNIPKLK